MPRSRLDWDDNRLTFIEKAAECVDEPTGSVIGYLGAALFFGVLFLGVALA